MSDPLTNDARVHRAESGRIVASRHERDGPGDGHPGNHIRLKHSIDRHFAEHLG
ncbi:hypothetical protein [Brachybacterium sacelli]|uniref:hypothetical protein n=1 Tax=Brachybacterium sacelli TaxID=173364 RepID=UPI003616A254